MAVPRKAQLDKPGGVVGKRMYSVDSLYCCCCIGSLFTYHALYHGMFSILDVNIGNFGFQVAFLSEIDIQMLANKCCLKSSTPKLQFMLRRCDFDMSQ